MHFEACISLVSMILYVGFKHFEFRFLNHGKTNRGIVHIHYTDPFPKIRITLRNYSADFPKVPDSKKLLLEQTVVDILYRSEISRLTPAFIHIKKE